MRSTVTRTRLALAPLLLIALAAKLPAQRAATTDTTRFVVLFSDRIAGHLNVWRQGAETVSDFEYNDRGRGPHVVERYATDPNGYLTAVSILGHNYYKDSVDEHYSYRNGSAHWTNHVEGNDSARGPITFYASLDGTPAETDPLLAALFNSRGKAVPLFPTGENTISHDRDLTITAPGHAPITVSLYSISGSGFSPFQVWLDTNRHFFGYVSAWSSTIRDGWQSAAPAMVAVQDSVAAARFQTLARTLSHRPAGPLVFRNAMVFDAENARMMPHTTVVISGNRIQSVSPDAAATIPATAEVIDATGKALLPGLWDMHVHLSPGVDGLMHLAAGVTTVRDMGNDTSVVLALKKKFNDGTEIGPRVVLAGLIDSPGPYQVPIGLVASTEAEARAQVDRYADLGFEQIKVYSSLKPELVPPIVEEAHKRGLRVSGHVPAFMTAEQVVRLGFDEVQHVNFLVLNFIDSVKDTRAMSRFTAVGNDAATLDLSSPRVRAFIQLLKDRHTVSDPTVGTFEDMFVARAGTMSPNMAMVADRLPPQVRRGLFSGGLPVTAANDQRYRDSYDAMLRLVDELYKAGVTIVAGTDGWQGFGLHRELELYVRAGIPAPQALKIATLTAARVMKHDDDRGSIAPGKLADVILVDGDPATNISDIRKVRTVVKDGVVFQSGDVYRAIAIKPQSVAPSAPAVAVDSELAARWLVVADSSALVPADRALWQRRFDAARDTVASVVDWDIGTGHADDALRLIIRLSRFWTGPTLVSAYERALVLPGAEPRIRARALNSAAAAAFRIKDQERTKRWASESIRMWRGIGDSAQAGRAYERLVQVALRDGDHPSLRAFADTGAALCVGAKDADCQAYMLNMRGESARVLKQYDSAVVYYTRAGTIYSSLSPLPKLDIVHNMGFALLAGGHVADACERFRSGLGSAVSAGDKPFFPFMLAGLASCNAMRGNATEAARLFGVSDAQLDQLGIVADPADAVEYERYRSVARAKLGSAAFDAAVKAGRALPADSVIASFR